MEKRTPDFKRRIGHLDRALRAENRNAPGPTGLIHERFTNFSRCHHDSLSNLTVPATGARPATFARRGVPRASGLAGRLGAIAMQ